MSSWHSQGFIITGTPPDERVEDDTPICYGCHAEKHCNEAYKSDRCTNPKILFEDIPVINTSSPFWEEEFKEAGIAAEKEDEKKSIA